MSDLKTRFEAAAAAIKVWNPSKAPSNEDKLNLYAFFKQATAGDCTTSRPGMFDLAGKAKWDAWTAQKGLSSEDAMTKYIEQVDRQRASYA